MVSVHTETLLRNEGEDSGGALRGLVRNYSDWNFNIQLQLRVTSPGAAFFLYIKLFGLMLMVLY